MERRLAAVLAADVVGYSRLVREDEAETLAVVRAHREQVIEPRVAAHKGRIVKLMGDGLLIEFASAVEAVLCAVEIQHMLEHWQSGALNDREIRYRIGINIGDIVVEDGDIHGDGVNVAARLEGLADAGGICIARNVFDQVKDKLDLTIEHLGARQVKNIAEPLHVYRVVLDETSAALVLPMSSVRPVRRLRVGMAALAAVALAAVGAVLWQQPWTAVPEPAAESQAGPALPGKPSIAVLAFENLNADASQAFISDGLSENIIIALSRFSDFFVIDRNSSFYYRDRPVKIDQLAAELGVRYVVSGSVQIAGDTLRATAQLVDAKSGKHLWAESYDRSLQDVFAIQDEITRMIAATLKENIELAEQDRVWREPTENLGAYEYRKRAQEQWFEFTRESNIRAEQLSEKAIALDPGYSGAYIELAWAHINGYRWGWSEGRSREESLDLAFFNARKALELDPYNFKAHWVLANATTQSGNLAKAAALYDRAIGLNPNSAALLADSIDPLVYGGRAPEAVERMRSAMRLNPHYPDWYLWNLGWAQYFAQQYAEALASIEQMNELPNELRRTLAPVLLNLNRPDDARAVIAEFLENRPDYSIEEAGTAPFEDEDYKRRWLDDLRALGVPETAS